MTAVDLLCPPACMHEPPGRAGSYADDVAEIAENIGRPLAPEQYAAVDVLVAHDRRGRFLSVEAGLEGPRQTVGKSGGIMLPIALWTALTDPDYITWTAHLAETSLKQFADLCGADPTDEAGLINSCDWLRKRVRKPSYENGSEGVTFANRAQIAFKVRSPGRSRGMSGNTIIDDELLFMTAEQIGASAPILATRSLHGNARAYRASSAARAKSHVLRALRKRALRADPTLTYVGWWAAGSWDNPGCADELCTHEVGSVGCSLDDEALLRTCNPLIGRLVSVEFLHSMRQAMTPLEFGVEFAGWEEPAEGDGTPAVTLEMWRAGADPLSVSTGRPVYGIDASPRLKSVAIIAATWRPDGRRHVEVVEHRPRSHWVVDRMKELRAKNRGPIVMSRSSPAAALLPDLLKAKLPVEMLSDAEMAQGCSTLEADMREGQKPQIVHTGDPIFERALNGASSRDYGDGGWLWLRKTSTADICPMVGMTVADVGLRKLIRPRSKSDLMNSFG